MCEPLTLRLPMPPSLNGAYANVPGKGRVATKALRSWKAAAAVSVRLALAGVSQRPVFTGLVDIEIKLPVSWASDADNRTKAIPDLLKDCGVLIDDKARYVRSVHTMWVYDGSLGVECSVTITQIADAPSEAATGASKGRKRPSPLSAEGRKETAVTGQRRPSQRPSTKAASDADVMRKLAGLGVHVDPSRIHVQGGS